MRLDITKPCKLTEKKWESCPDCGSVIECNYLDNGEAVLNFPSNCKTKQFCLDRHSLLFGIQLKPHRRMRDADESGY